MAPIRGESLGTLYRTIVQEAEYSRRRDVRSERLGLIEQLGYVAPHELLRRRGPHVHPRALLRRQRRGRQGSSVGVARFAFWEPRRLVQTPQMMCTTRGVDSC